jgi:hypothetical protein
MEPPHLVTRPSKVVGGERASIAHPWNLWGIERVFAQDKAKVPQTGMEWQGQSSELVRPRVDLEEYVETLEQKVVLCNHTLNDYVS